MPELPEVETVARDYASRAGSAKAHAGSLKQVSDRRLMISARRWNRMGSEG